MDDWETRERIANAAEELFYLKGYARVGMDEIRTHARVSLRRLYALFTSKSAIVTEVLDRKRAEWESGLEAAIEAGDEAPEARVLAVFDYLDGWFRDPAFRGCAFINAFGELGGTDTDVAHLVREHKAAFQRRMSTLVTEAGGSSLLAAQLALLAEGAQSTAAICRDAGPAAQARLAAEALIAHDLAQTRSLGAT